MPFFILKFNVGGFTFCTDSLKGNGFIKLNNRFSFTFQKLRNTEKQTYEFVSTKVLKMPRTKKKSCWRGGVCRPVYGTSGYIAWSKVTGIKGHFIQDVCALQQDGESENLFTKRHS